ncbi:MAG TPA: ornithine cyclodeaminase family protein [Stellaceae bacterium]|nr:ornithine cyclodeaminase family protein [Stellaceae bacterium]
MTLILGNEEVEQLLDMRELIPALEESYVELVEGRGANGPRGDLTTPTALHPDGLYALKVQCGVLPKQGVGVVRINSDILVYPETGGGKRREKLPAVDGRYVGLLLFFSTEDGAPLMICPDAAMQRLRVGATNAIAAKYLAPKAPRRAAILGSSGQAEAQLLGLDALYPLEDVRVFSPDRAHREAFAARMAAKTGRRVRACDSGAEACAGAEIVACATNSLAPVFFKDWLARGMHVSSISSAAAEIDPAAWSAFDRMAAFNRADYVLTIATHGLKRADGGGGGGKLPPDLPILPDIVAGRAEGRRRDDETTCFFNNLGMGYQFATAGALVYRKARAQGLGRALPTEWFTETQAS